MSPQSPLGDFSSLIIDMTGVYYLSPALPHSVHWETFPGEKGGSADGEPSVSIFLGFCWLPPACPQKCCEFLVEGFGMK